MGKPRETKAIEVETSAAPALSVESRENQLIALAVDEAERQLREHTASSQVITHFLKLGTTMAQLEREKLEKENKLLAAKTEAIESAKDVKVLYEKAMSALSDYQGKSNDEDDEDM